MAIFHPIEFPLPLHATSFQRPSSPSCPVRVKPLLSYDSPKRGQDTESEVSIGKSLHPGTERRRGKITSVCSSGPLAMTLISCKMH
ncbi:hypothetical protein M405DRAFT_820374 [Rhizopogon salebrosus TDB-379]|nr:hypothetical protein M405DRAFT_820374 [Rhizopogon salebrosus TDB-379]